MKKLVFALALAVSIFAQAQKGAIDDRSRTKMQQELDFIGSLFSTAYAPRVWKQTHLGWDLSAQMSLAQARLAAAQNMDEARRVVADLLYSTADYHVGFSFFSTEVATLPFQVKTVQGKTLIVYVDRSKLGDEAFPFQVGDELLTMNGVPVSQVLGEMVKINGANVPGTDLAIADLNVTRRRGARGIFNVPNGPVAVSVKRATDDSVGTAQLVWEYTPEELHRGSGQLLSRNQSSFLSRKMISPRAMDFMTADENPYGLGGRKPFLPNLGERVWETAADNTFDAYIYRNEEGRLIGVVRIFGYIVDDYKKAISDFTGIMTHFQKHTEAMVIDQNNNPGGSVFYLYALASLVSDQTLTVPRHQIAILDSDAQECVDFQKTLVGVKNDTDAQKVLGEEMDGYPATYQLALGISDYCNFLMKEYNAGKFLSEPYYLWGVDKITPNKSAYTKPIAILVNQLDFSGGDFFPAILQDNKRVTVVGVRTAGAGGYVQDVQYPSAFGLQHFSFTGSLAERVNLQPIENLGVTPDVALEMTVDDVRNSYKNYLDGVRTVVKGLVSK
ncbi:MAG: protease-like activity factor CPAF [Pseudobdellovibrionaceae bacterium]